MPDIPQRVSTLTTTLLLSFTEASQFMGQFNLGASVLVDLWEFNGPFNTTMKTAVLHEECVPVTEEIYMRRGGKHFLLLSDVST